LPVGQGSSSIPFVDPNQRCNFNFALYCPDIGKVLAEELRVFSMQYADAFGLFFHTQGRPPRSESNMEQTTIAYLERRYAALEKEIENALQHGPPTIWQLLTLYTAS
jgi:hypothetical protein